MKSTSRMMHETGGNVGVVIATCGHDTLRMLEQFKIPYDEIHFGQPFAHVYVDASVASASGVDTAKELGWRVTSGPQLEPGMVAARHFNNVQLEGDCIVKTASSSVLRGEIFFYQRMPSDIANWTTTKNFVETHRNIGKLVSTRIALSQQARRDMFKFKTKFTALVLWRSDGPSTPGMSMLAQIWAREP